MTASLAAAAGRPAPGDDRPASRQAVTVVVAAVVLVLVGWLGYQIGAHRNAGGHVLTGRAFTTGSQVQVRVDGWVYGFDITPNMQWYDARGGSHDGLIPPCLRRPGDRHVWLRFAYSVAPALDGGVWGRPVAWVQCLPGRR